MAGPERGARLPDPPRPPAEFQLCLSIWLRVAADGSLVSSGPAQALALGHCGVHFKLAGDGSPQDHWCFGFGTLWGEFRLDGCPCKAQGINMMPQEAVSHSVLRPPCLELGPCMLQLETRVGMWSLELIRATKRKNDPNDSRHCQCGREGKRLEPHCRTGIRKVCASFLYSRSRTLPEGPRGSPRPLLGEQRP